MPAIASKSFKAGDVIFECKPIIHCIEREFKGNHCDNCLKKSQSLKKCSKCEQMYYCDEECQQNDWKHHKNECKVLRGRYDYNDMNIILKLILRLWLNIKFTPDFATKGYQLIDGSDVCLNDIKVDIELLKRNKREMQIFGLVCEHFQALGVCYDRKELLRVYGLVDMFLLSALHHYTDNPEEMSISSFQERVGSATFIQKPNLRHSCLPNSGVVKNGVTYQYRAMKAIAKDEEITEAFADLGQNRNKRNKQLVDSHYTVCECDKCRLYLDKDIDYDEFHILCGINDNDLSLIGNKSMVAFLYSEYQMNGRLIEYFKEIYGENDVYNSEKLVLSFICFALYSKKSSESLIKFWYKQIEPTLQITHGSDHPTYKLFQNVYQKSMKI